MSMNPYNILNAQSPTPQIGGPTELYDKNGRLVNCGALTPWTTAQLAAGSAAGTGPTIALTAGRNTNDQGGSIDVTVGSAPSSAQVIVTCTFLNPYPVPPKVFINTENGGGINAITPLDEIIAGTITTTGFQIFLNGTTALTQGNIHRFLFWVVP